LAQFSNAEEDEGPGGIGGAVTEAESGRPTGVLGIACKGVDCATDSPCGAAAGCGELCGTHAGAGSGELDTTCTARQAVEAPYVDSESLSLRGGKLPVVVTEVGLMGGCNREKAAFGAADCGGAHSGLSRR
jgi:hypothetical protein